MTVLDITIRRARMADHAGLCALCDVLDEQHRLARPDLFRRLEGPARGSAWLAALLYGGDAAIFVADTGSGIAGFAVVRRRTPSPASFVIPQPYAELEEIIVAPERRRRGVGRALIQAARTWAEAQGIPRFCLQAHEFNVSALAFYDSLGFTVMTRRMEMTVPARIEANLDQPPWT